MQARYWGEAGEILSIDDSFVLVLFPDGDRYRFPRGIIGLELPSECHTYKISVTSGCAICGAPLAHRRARSRTCSTRCRKALSRRSVQQ